MVLGWISFLVLLSSIQCHWGPLRSSAWCFATRRTFQLLAWANHQQHYSCPSCLSSFSCHCHCFPSRYRYHSRILTQSRCLSLTRNHCQSRSRSQIHCRSRCHRSLNRHCLIRNQNLIQIHYLCRYLLISNNYYHMQRFRLQDALDFQNFVCGSLPDILVCCFCNKFYLC